jgi:tRNA threonylcarbamoyladenosine biosynthesis protein TsaE
VNYSITCAVEADTRALGRRLASLLRPGDVILLAGDLGAGKTVFASGIAEGLGVEDRVVSPSFVLTRRYRGLVPMVHADLYRVGSSGEVEDLDLVEEASGGVLVVEWGNVAEPQFADELLVVRLEVCPDGGRTISLVPHGGWRTRPLREVVA